MKGNHHILAFESAVATAVGSASLRGDVPVQRFIKKVIPCGKFVKRGKPTVANPLGEVLFELSVDRPEQEQYVASFRAMKDNKIPVRIMDETGNYSLELTRPSPLTKNHAGAFDKNKAAGLKNMVENIVADVDDLYIDSDGWVTAAMNVEGKENIELVQRSKFTSPEIQDCYIDGTEKRYGKVIRAISLVANPLIPNQKEFEPIAASADEPEILVLSEDSPMKLAAILAAIAATAGVETSKVTEDNAVDMLKGVQTRVTEQGDRIKALSAETPAPRATELRMCAKFGAQEITRLVSEGVVSEAGGKELGALFIGDTTKAAYSPFILSADTPDEAASFVEKVVGVLLKNPGKKTGTKTALQDLKALSEDAPENTPMTPERTEELLMQTTTGRELVRAARERAASAR